MPKIARGGEKGQRWGEKHISHLAEAWCIRLTAAGDALVIHPSCLNMVQSSPSLTELRDF